MSNLIEEKTYGLSMNKKVSTMPHLHNPLNPLMAKSKFNKTSILGAEEESDSDDGVRDHWVKKAMMKETKLKKQTKNSMAAALEEDPTVFQYDRQTFGDEKGQVEQLKVEETEG